MKRFTPGTRFKKRVKKVPREIISALKKRMVIFEKNEFEEILSNHKLYGKYIGCRSINITGDWRLVYENKGNNSYLLVDIGTHSQLFG